MFQAVMFSDKLVVHVYPFSFCLRRTPCPVLGWGKRIFWPPKAPRTVLENIQPPLFHVLRQCFSTAGPRPRTGPWHQLYRAARCSPGICHFSFL